MECNDEVGEGKNDDAVSYTCPCLCCTFAITHTKSLPTLSILQHLIMQRSLFAPLAWGCGGFRRREELQQLLKLLEQILRLATAAQSPVVVEHTCRQLLADVKFELHNRNIKI